MNSTKILFLMIGNIIGYLFDLLYFMLSRIYFDIEVIGAYGIIISYFSLFSFVLTFGFSVTYLKLHGETINNEEKAITNGTFLFFRVIQFLTYVLIAFILIPFFNIKYIDFTELFLFFIGFIFANFSYQIFSQLLITQKRIFTKSLILTTSIILKNILIITLVRFFRPNLKLLIYIYMIVNFLFFFIYFIPLSQIKIKKPNKESLNKFIKNSYFMIITSSLLAILGNVDVIFISNTFTITDVANYFTAKQIFNYFIALITGIHFFLIPVFSKNIKLDNGNENLEAIKKIHKFFNIIIVFVASLIIIYSIDVVTLFFGEKYKNTAVILSILSISFILISISFGQNIHLRALGENSFYSILLIFEYLVSLVILIIFISPLFLNLGPIGAAISLVFSSILTQLITRPIIYRKYGIGFYWGVFRNLLIMVSIILLHIYVLNVYFNSILFIPVFIIIDAVLYFVINYLTRGYSKEDIKYFFNIIRFKTIKISILSELGTNKKK